MIMTNKETVRRLNKVITDNECLCCSKLQWLNTMCPYNQMNISKIDPITREISAPETTTNAFSSSQTSVCDQNKGSRASGKCGPHFEKL